MKIYENGILRDMTAAEIAAIEAIPVEPVPYSASDAMEVAAKILLRASVPEDAATRIVCAALLPEWAAGVHKVGEVYAAEGQVWECYQAYDNATHPDIKPGNAAWYTFNRPMHGTSRETARYFVQPKGAHDIYKAGEWAIHNGKMCRCKQDTAHSPTDYPQAWEVGV
nr:MAG TPA: hypothetical protein [Caudoviricetes sp.]